jgi:hypothetical protein
MKTAAEIAEEIGAEHEVFLTISRDMMMRQMAHERLLSVVMMILAKCLSDDARRDLFNELYKISWPTDPPAGASGDERRDHTEMARRAEEYHRRLIDDVVKGLGDVHIERGPDRT